MYTVNVQYTDYAGHAKRKSVAFNLDSREVFKLLVELTSLFEWLKANKESAEKRELSVEEVRDFYNNLEGVMLEAWGEMSEDGEHFRKSERYLFEESKAFDACMWMFVDKPEEAVRLLEGMLPKELYDMVEKATPDQIADATSAKAIADQEEIQRLRAQVSEMQRSSPTNTNS